MKLPKKPIVEVELTTADRRAREVLTLPLVKAPLAYGVWPSSKSQLLQGNIGYLRLPSMEAVASVAEIKPWMPVFRDTDGLIVDVRDNNGGERDALLLLYSYLTAEKDLPRITNAAVYRLFTGRDENYLATNHRMYRADAKEWSPAERTAVSEFAKKFKPQLKLSGGQFSEWHYMKLTRLNDADIYYYDKPVIILMNEKCFSATDIFLTSLKGLKNVTLLGTTSSGGSAYGQQVSLAETSLKVNLGSMVSFQSDGRLFDGNGILPDVFLSPVPEYFINGRDNVLQEARTRIKNYHK
jgi:C-terminal processing protease CtpA/Prc